MRQEDGVDAVDGEKLIWQWYDFDSFTAQELYAILALRQQVFVVEQQCPYLDCDDLDQTARHLVGWEKPGKSRRPLAYLRLLPPGKKMICRLSADYLPTKNSAARVQGKNFSCRLWHKQNYYTPVFQ